MLGWVEGMDRFLSPFPLQCPSLSLPLCLSFFSLFPTLSLSFFLEVGLVSFCFSAGVGWGRGTCTQTHSLNQKRILLYWIFFFFFNMSSLLHDGEIIFPSSFPDDTARPSRQGLISFFPSLFPLPKETNLQWYLFSKQEISKLLGCSDDPLSVLADRANTLPHAVTKQKIAD